MIFIIKGFRTIVFIFIVISGWYVLRVRQTAEEGRKTYRPKRCGNNNKNEDNSPKTLHDLNSMFSTSIGENMQSQIL